RVCCFISTLIKNYFKEKPKGVLLKYHFEKSLSREKL
ncbi:unnamed protein product, partial [marine sediment metagenome]